MHGSVHKMARLLLYGRQGAVTGQNTVKCVAGFGEHPFTQIVEFLAAAPSGYHQVAGSPENVKCPPALLGSIPFPWHAFSSHSRTLKIRRSHWSLGANTLQGFLYRLGILAHPVMNSSPQVVFIRVN